MNKQELFLSDYKSVIAQAIANKQDIALYAILPKDIVYKGIGDIDEEYCKAHDIDIYNSVDFGGGIVGFKGDIVLIILKQDGWDIGVQFENKLIDLFKRKGLNAKLDNNDILIDERYKVASYSSVNVGNGFIYTGIQITLNADAEIISHICKKPMNKIPKGLSEFGVTTEEVEEFIQGVI